MKKLVFVLTIVILTISSAADVITIKPDGTGDYATIQAAIDAAVNGDTVIVADGTYTGTGNYNITFSGKIITVRSQNGPENCIIDCQNIPGSNGFSFTSGETIDAVLDGFTIKNALYASGLGGGNGIYCYNYSSPTISNCIISGNNRSGIYCYSYSSPTISNCIISGNTASFGGGIYCGFSSSPTISNCSISGNTAGSGGGGIYCLSSSPTISNCSISGNTAPSGGGICFSGGSPRVSKCVISDNTGEGIKGGSSTTSISNSAVFHNTSYGISGSLGPITNCVIAKNGNTGLYNCTGLITNSIIWANAGNPVASTKATYNCIQGGLTGTGNIDYDPCFVNIDANDFHLLPNSPCIDAGDPAYITNPNETDIDGEPRVVGYSFLRIDMGIDEVNIPKIITEKPRSGVIWTNGSSHQIKWKSYLLDGTVDLLFSENAGTDWQTIDSNIPDAETYSWVVPGGIDSNQCVIKVEPHIPDSNCITTSSGIFTVRPYTPGQIVTSKWKTLGGDFDRTGTSSDFGPELGCVKWQFQTNGAVSSSPTIGHDGRIHIACEDGNLYTIDADGSLMWTYNADFPLTSSPTIGADGTVYAGAENGWLYAIDVNGIARWTFATDGPVWSSPAVSPDGNTVYMGSGDGTLYALGRDGSERWTFSTISAGTQHKGSVLASPAVGPDGTVYISQTYDPNLYALNPDDGSVIWNCPFESKGWPYAAPVIGSSGTIYQTLVYDPNLYAVDSNNGDILWSLNLADQGSGWYEVLYNHPTLGSQYYLSDISIGEITLAADGTIYASLDDPYLRAINPDGTIKWVTRLGMIGGFTMTVAADGLIYAASDDNYLCVVSPDGVELSRLKADDWLIYPVLTDDNTIIVSGAEDRTVFKTAPQNAVRAISASPCDGNSLDLRRPMDLNGENTVNLKDYSILASEWLNCSDTAYDFINYYTFVPRCDYSGTDVYYTGDADRNLHVNTDDLIYLAENWLSEN